MEALQEQVLSLMRKEPPIAKLPVNQILCGDCRDVIKTFPPESVDMVMFSPPYWGLRDYGKRTETVWGGDPKCQHVWAETKSTLVHENRNFLKGSQEEVHGKKKTTYIKKFDDKMAGFCVKCGAWRGQLGLEPTWQMYVEHMVEVCQAVKRVLKKTGSMYIVLGDTYAGSWCGRGDKRPKQNFRKEVNDIYGKTAPQRYADMPPKCLIGIPWRVAFALIEDCWILRNQIVWHKTNAMPGSQKDRLTQTCEVIFHFVKNTGKALLWRNELTGKWVSEKPNQVYYHVETHEIRRERPSKEERYVVDESGHRHLVWKPLWRGFDYYYELDAIREPHKTANELFTRKTKPFGKRGSPSYRNAPVEQSYGFNHRQVLIQKLFKIAQQIRGSSTYHGKSVDFSTWNEKLIHNKAFRDALKILEKKEKLSKEDKRFLRDYVQNHVGHPKGKNPGDVVSPRVKANLEHFVQRGSGGHYAYGGLDSKEGKHKHPSGKNPGDVTLAKHDLAINRVGNFSYTDPLHVKAYHSKGKNPGDIITTFQRGLEEIYGNLDLEAQYESKYGESNYGQTLQSFVREQKLAKIRAKSREVARKLFPDDERLQQDFVNWVHDHAGHVKGKNPGDVVKSTSQIALEHGYNPEGICPTCGRKYKRHAVRSKDRRVGLRRQFIPCNPLGKDPGDYWSIPTKPFKGAHFAVYPEEICVKPIKSSCPPNGVVLDIMCGSGTTLVATQKLGRRWIGIEINPEYVEIAKRRLAKECSEKLTKWIGD